MPQPIELYPVSPASFEGRAINETWTRAGLFRTIREHENYPHERVGVVICTGFIEALDFQHTDAAERAMRVDGIILWIPRLASYPPRQTGEPRIPISGTFKSVTKFPELHALLKALINGVEIQLTRRVLVIGAEVPDVGNWRTHWVKVPTISSERYPGDPSLLTLTTPATVLTDN